MGDKYCLCFFSSLDTLISCRDVYCDSQSQGVASAVLRVQFVTLKRNLQVLRQLLQLVAGSMYKGGCGSDDSPIRNFGLLKKKTERDKERLGIGLW